MNDEILDWRGLMRNGENARHEKTFERIREHLEHARQKHPWPDGMTAQEKYRVAERELLEMAAAMLKGDQRGAREEALDCIAVLVRIAEGDGCEDITANSAIAHGATSEGAGGFAPGASVASEERKNGEATSPSASQDGEPRRNGAEVE